MKKCPEVDIVPLAPGMNFDRFDCGEESLNGFLLQFASQNERKGYGRTFCLVERVDQQVIGYYTSAAGSISFEYVPVSVQKRVPKYPMPVFHLARLAVDLRNRDCGFGSMLLVHCLRRAVEAERILGIAAVEVRALTHDAQRFYSKFGFESLSDGDLHLYLPMKSVHEAVNCVEDS